MTDKRLTDLDAVTTAAADDVMYLVTAAGVSKQITVGDLAAAMVAILNPMEVMAPRTILGTPPEPEDTPDDR